jgi:superfamily I DNA/RNA helicase
MTPTGEQTEAIELFGAGANLAINAFAGSGKTTTLKLLGATTKKKGIYLAYNKFIADSAKSSFPANIACSTIHSIAYRATPAGFRSNDKMTGKLNVNALSKHLSLKDWHLDREHKLSARHQAHLVLDTIRRFTQSDSQQVVASHVPIHGKLITASAEIQAGVAQVTARRAQDLWARMSNSNDALPLGHDGYLKLWALGTPRLSAEFVMLDEAQDSNPLVLSVLSKQSAQVVYVGDRYQQIYDWRGAINAMEKVSVDHQTNLTLSFRFGEKIADAASAVLATLGEKTRIRGNPLVTSYLSSDQADCVLARTNASVISSVIEHLGRGSRPLIVGGTAEILGLLRGVEELKSGRASIVAEFFGFLNWHEVVEFSQNPEGEHLRTFVKVVAEHGEQKLIGALEKTADTEDQADVVISTAHKAKGREWPRVRLIDDFLKSKSDDEIDRADPAEVRLFYVALTRAQKAIDVAFKTLQMFQIDQGDKFMRQSSSLRSGEQASQAMPMGAPHIPNEAPRISVETSRFIPLAVKPPTVQPRSSGLAWYWWLLIAVLVLGFFRSR